MNRLNPFEDSTDDAIAANGVEGECIAQLMAGVQGKGMRSVARTMQPHFDIFLGNAECVRGFGGAQSFHVPEDEDGAVSSGQGFDDLLKEAADLRRGGRLLRVGSGRSETVHPVSFSPCNVVVFAIAKTGEGFIDGGYG